jgi:SH3-like domain-containing protein
MLKKINGILLMMCIWLCMCGFTGIEKTDTLSGTVSGILDQLTPEDVDTLLKQDEWASRVMAKVEESVSIRETPDTEGTVVGKLYKGGAGEILEQVDGWTQIQSGEVTGWVNNDYLAFGEEAAALAETDVPKIATVRTQTLNVRDEASTDAPIVDMIGLGETIEVGDEVDGWLQILYSDGEVDYISAEYVEVSREYGQAKTIQQIEAEEAARKAAEEKAKRTKNLGAIAASNDELTLLAALIQAEGGNQPYEGQVAIGAVVMNRVRSDSYPNTIQGVISAPGQFGPASTGQVASIMASGPKASCMQAAQAALNGETTVGTATHFRNASSGAAGYVIGNHVFY